MLDADVYDPGKLKPRKDSTKFPSHHTPKAKDAAKGLYIYQFTFDGIELELQVQFTAQQDITGKSAITASSQQNIPGTARIVSPVKAPDPNPGLEAWFKST
jgi:hypothetical protein